MKKNRIIHTCIAIFILCLYSNICFATDNAEISFQKSVIAKYNDYSSFLNYLETTPIKKLAEQNPQLKIFQHRIEVMQECGKKYKHLKSQDFINATQDCLWKWKQYWNCSDGNDDSCLFLFDNEGKIYEHMKKLCYENEEHCNSIVIKGWGLGSKGQELLYEAKLVEIKKKYGVQKKEHKGDINSDTKYNIIGKQIGRIIAPMLCIWILPFIGRIRLIHSQLFKNKISYHLSSWYGFLLFTFSAFILGEKIHKLFALLFYLYPILIIFMIIQVQLRKRKTSASK